MTFKNKLLPLAIAGIIPMLSACGGGGGDSGGNQLKDVTQSGIFLDRYETAYNKTPTQEKVNSLPTYLYRKPVEEFNVTYDDYYGEILIDIPSTFIRMDADDPNDNVLLRANA